jgi:hypothetical protein
MARKIRQLGLKLIVLTLRACVRAAPAGWRRSTRASTLRGT